ncbi:MAG: hypothetical protein HPZ91_08395 [Lentisphaeria bacterium]|nr:hypothetical protein [Lentisphaeria bacterium]
MKNLFTLIELLIIIAIIAILASMLLPALNQARARARSTDCLGNQKSIGTVMRMYLDDNRDFIMPSGGVKVAGISTDAYRWQDYLYAYHAGTGLEKNCFLDRAVSPVRPLKMFRCPGWVPATADEAAYYLTHYSINRCFASDEVVRRSSQIKSPSHRAMILEGISLREHGRRPLTHAIWLRHNGSMNFVFADGHAAARKAYEIPEANYTANPPLEHLEFWGNMSKAE